MAAVLLVLVRSAAMLAFEQLDFDSDQAIVGLMAKHLSEGRTFPLFFYGQHYMLGVQAWIAAPFFWIGGPTVAMLRMPLLIINCSVAVWLLAAFAERTGSPWWALAAVLPFAAAAPVFSSALLETLGASVEPFLYVLALWSLRRRPALFGTLLGVAFLHREFTIFAVLGVAVATYRESGSPVIASRGWTLRAIAAFAVVWLIVDQLKRHISVLGPAGGPVETAPLTVQLQFLMSIVTISPSVMLPKLSQALRQGLVDLLGMRAIPALQYNVNSTAIVGSAITAIALLAAAVVCAARLAVRRQLPSPFCIYLALVGLQALIAYAFANGVDPNATPILRYMLLAVLLPIAIIAAFLESEPRFELRLIVAVLLVICAAMNIRDQVRIIAEYRRDPPPNEHRVLADDLVAHGIRYGSAIYWDAYIVDFLSRERVILTSTDKMRIASYQARVEKNSGVAARVVRVPCSEGRHVASWCVIDPFNR